MYIKWYDEYVKYNFGIFHCDKCNKYTSNKRCNCGKINYVIPIDKDLNSNCMAYTYLDKDSVKMFFYDVSNVNEFARIA
jgi:hypothetical protein